MARFTEPTPEQKKLWAEWVASRPKSVRTVAERFEPWSLYRHKTTGQRVTIYSFDEEENGEVTVRMNVTGEFNAVAFDRTVFGVDPNQLEPCELPDADEVLGSALDATEVEALRVMVRPDLWALRVMVRPDLWAFDESGKAVRKS